MSNSSLVFLTSINAAKCHILVEPTSGTYINLLTRIIGVNGFPVVKATTTTDKYKIKIR